jgi:hypothetical protein
MEGYLWALKQKVRNRARLEACMASRYMYDEALGFCTKYFALYLNMCPHMWDVNEEDADIGEVLEGHAGASKILFTYLLPCFLLENKKTTKFQTSNLLLAFQNKMIFFFFMDISSLLTFKSNLCHIIWT